MKVISKKEIKLAKTWHGYKLPEKGLLVDGNDKIGKGIFHYSTLPGTKEYTHSKLNFTTCGTCPCNCIGCYGMSGNYTRYKSIYDSLALRTIIARLDLDFMVDEINKQIAKQNIKYIRIHATGDFFSADYVKAWIKIAKENPNTIFWTYTKATFKELDELNSLENVNIVSSVVPGKGFNFGKCDYILNTYEYLKSIGENPYICRCGIDDNQHCNTCKGCSKHKYVLFLEHSTGYNAEKDKLFPVVKQLIENQAFSEF